MKIERVVPVWQTSHPAAPSSDRTSPAGIVDRIERVGNGLERKIAVRIQGMQKLEAQGLRGPTTTLALLGAKGRDGILHREGYPELPAVRFFVTAEKKEDIRVKLGAERKLAEPLHLSVCQPSVPKSGKVPEDVAAVAFDGFYPPRRFEIEPVGTVGGKTRFMVSVYPVAVTRDGRASVVADFDIAAAAPEGATVERHKNGRQKAFAFVVGQRFADSPSVAAYKALKERSGFRVETIVVGDTVKTPDDIRARLKALFHDSVTDLQYALLIGDLEDVPAPRATSISGVTDHYYRAIDTDGYEADINGPDIGVGRLPITNEEELAGVIGKLTTYSEQSFSSRDWMGQVSFLATNDKWEIAEGSHNYAIDKYTKRQGLIGSFPKLPQPGGDTVYAITHQATAADAVRTAGEGRTLINYSGHGAKTYWANPRVNQADVRALAHRDALPFVISNACITGDFAIPECFAETWIRHPKGAVMFWGSVVNTLWKEDDILERAMYDGIFQHDKKRFSEITQYALQELWRHYGGSGKSKYYWETYTTFGDPSLNLLIEREQDTTAPAAPTDLTATDVTATRCLLRLTATGDDGMKGQAFAYDVRISDKPIVDGEPEPGQVSFADATRIPAASPKAAGDPDEIPVPIMPGDQSRPVHVAVKVIDNFGNASAMVGRELSVPAATLLLGDGPGSFVADPPWGRVDIDGRTGVWTDSPAGNYANDANTALTSVPIELAGHAGAQLHFDGKHALEINRDFVYVEVAEEGGAWLQAIELGDTHDWQHHVVDLAPWAGKTVRVRIRLVSDGFATKDGIYVDQLKVVADS